MYLQFYCLITRITTIGNWWWWTFRVTYFLPFIRTLIWKLWVATSTGICLHQSPSNCDARVCCILMRMQDERCLSVMMESSLRGGSSGWRNMSNILPLAPFVTSRSISMFAVTMTFTPTANLTALGKSLFLLDCCHSPLWTDWFMTSYCSAKVGCIHIWLHHMLVTKMHLSPAAAIRRTCLWILSTEISG